MSKTLNDAKKLLAEIATELNACETREEKLATLIFYGNKLVSLDKTRQNAQTKVPGCASETYLDAHLDETKHIHFEGASNSLIVKGYLYLFSEAFNGLSSSDAAQNIKPIAENFVKVAQVDESLMPSRVNTFLNLILQMEKLAKAL